MSKHDQKTRHVGLAHGAQPPYLALTNFGEVSTRATIRCCVRCWGPFGLAQLLGGSGGRRAIALPVDPRFWPFKCNLQSSGTLAEHPFYILHFTFYTLPARWRVLGAALRRAIASRKAVPADVKDQFCVPLHSSFQRERGKVYPIPLPNASGDFEN